MNKIDEDWRPTNPKVRRGDTIIAVSNRGRIKRANGDIEESFLRQKIRINGKETLIYRFIAEHFIQQTDEDKALKRDCIDHITHNPIGMNVNDVRNLRWCTHKENNNFHEAKENHSKVHLNKPTSEFGRKYFEHYGYSRTENNKQYMDAYNWYIRHNKVCKWE